MNRLLSVPALVIGLLFTACEKKGFDYKMYQATLEDIDSVYFSATDKMLIADGQARLDFIVEAYRHLTLSTGKDTFELVDLKQFPEGVLKVIEEVSGREVGLSYSSTTIPVDTVKFHAEIGPVRSETKKVALREKPVLPPKVYVDVIFHVWELNPTHSSYDVSSYQNVTHEQLVAAVQYMNELINNKWSHSPNGTSANVEFRLAAKNYLGQTLAQPGFNKQLYSDNVKVNPLATSISYTDVIAYINTNKATLIWNPKAFLNVQVLPMGTNYATSAGYPAKQLAPATGEEAVLGIPTTAVDENDFTVDYANTCVGLPRTIFFPGFERKIEAFKWIGNFYGLYTPLYGTSGRLHHDYCYDTRKFNGQHPFNASYAFAMKVGIDNDKYVTDNVMDDSRYPTLVNSITADQVARMRAVMAKCPGRMNSKTQ
ncbi:MAG: hypothetical protein P0Y53_17850 [Candidatus Pseudobacter hemicellulosilyticus]|uniref:Uncharacterized protein n=1 Tax=Candidatus Pseudobacter hemicellulosilyticus TaxID=3121375 RepID=A0AAJ6BES5_9BACT|nr:MAG: hypothetical protein P0Y53_17850 [Pseudobacter sp.]